MLVITRRPQELVRIEDRHVFFCKIIEIDGQQAKIAFDAPKAVSIVRAEIYDPRDKRKYGTVNKAAGLDQQAQIDELREEMNKQMDTLNKKVDRMSDLPEQMQRIMEALLQQVPTVKRSTKTKKAVNAK